jgi:hypothetical protein
MSQKIMFKCRGDGKGHKCDKKITYTHDKPDSPVRLEPVELTCGKHSQKYNVAIYKCKEPKCKEEVIYSAEGIQIPVVRAVKTTSTQTPPKNTLTVYLTCNAGHCFPYEVEESEDKVKKPEDDKDGVITACSTSPSIFERFKLRGD